MDRHSAFLHKLVEPVIEPADNFLCAMKKTIRGCLHGFGTASRGTPPWCIARTMCYNKMILTGGWSAIFWLTAVIGQNICFPALWGTIPLWVITTWPWTQDSIAIPPFDSGYGITRRNFLSYSLHTIDSPDVILALSTVLNRQTRFKGCPIAARRQYPAQIHNLQTISAYSVVQA